MDAAVVLTGGPAASAGPVRAACRKLRELRMGDLVVCGVKGVKIVPEFRPLTGRHPRVAKYIRSFPQTQEFITRISDLLVYLLPHYIHEGKSYLTIGFGCTGGQHRSVMIAEDVARRLKKAGYRVKVLHRDSPK